jgi:hypothetical protein
VKATLDDAGKGRAALDAADDPEVLLTEIFSELRRTSPGAHHPLDRRTRLQVAGDRHRLGGVVPTDGMRQRVDQGVDRARVFLVVILHDPGPATRVEVLGGEVVLDQLADLDPPQVGGAHRDAVGSAG